MILPMVFPAALALPTPLITFRSTGCTSQHGARFAFLMGNRAVTRLREKLGKFGPPGERLDSLISPLSEVSRLIFLIERQGLYPTRIGSRGSTNNAVQ